MGAAGGACGGRGADEGAQAAKGARTARPDKNRRQRGLGTVFMSMRLITALMAEKPRAA